MFVFVTMPSCAICRFAAPSDKHLSHLNQLIMCHLNNQLIKSQLNPQRVCVSHQHLNQQTQVIIAVVTSPKR